MRSTSALSTRSISARTSVMSRQSAGGRLAMASMCSCRKAGSPGGLQTAARLGNCTALLRGSRRGLQAGGRQLLHLALRLQLLEPDTFLGTGFARLVGNGHQPRRHLRIEIGALGLEAVELCQRPILDFDV